MARLTAAEMIDQLSSIGAASTEDVKKVFNEDFWSPDARQDSALGGNKPRAGRLTRAMEDPVHGSRVNSPATPKPLTHHVQPQQQPAMKKPKNYRGNKWAGLGEDQEQQVQQVEERVPYCRPVIDALTESGPEALKEATKLILRGAREVF